MRPIRLPAGLVDKGYEFFINKGELLFIHNGKVCPFELLHEDVQEAYLQHMLANKPAMASLRKDFGLNEIGDMLQQYIKCNFGNYDNVPDMDEDGTIFPECWDCGNRGTCLAEGKVCSRIQGPKGILTKKETEIFFLLIQGQSHKMIAALYDNDIQTIEYHLKMIRDKLNCHSSIEVMDYAVKRRLI